MLNHIMVGSNNIERSKKFYDAILGLLGASQGAENENDSGQIRVVYVHSGSTFVVTEPINGQAASVSNGSTIGFKCSSPEQIKEFHDVAIANGGTSAEDPPGPRGSQSTGVTHLCYFLDPDGHKICGVHRVA